MGDLCVLVHNGCRSKNKLKPDPYAEGAHATFKYGVDGTIEHYAIYEPNPQNPTGFDEVLKYDGVGKEHGGIPTPHIHGANGVRPAYSWEIPRKK